jgi:hypothetical protein
MGYFPNGCAGEDYQAKWCRRCVHDVNEDCAVWMVHLLANYEECDRPDSLLHVLIPRENVDNQRCRMFLEIGTLRKE